MLLETPVASNPPIMLWGHTNNRCIETNASMQYVNAIIGSVIYNIEAMFILFELYVPSIGFSSCSWCSLSCWTSRFTSIWNYCYCNEISSRSCGRMIISTCCHHACQSHPNYLRYLPIRISYSTTTAYLKIT